jgi:hypothetical protein
MKPLAKTNPYLRDPKEVKRMVTASTLDSCAFEGLRAAKKIQRGAKARSIASAKKAASNSYSPK